MRSAKKVGYFTLNGEEIIKTDKIKKLVKQMETEEAKILAREGIEKLTVAKFFDLMTQEPTNDSILKFSKEMILEYGGADTLGTFITRIINKAKIIDLVLSRDEVMLMQSSTYYLFENDFDKVFYRIQWESLNKNIVHIFEESDFVNIIGQINSQIEKYDNDKKDILCFYLGLLYKKRLEAFLHFKEEYQRLKK